MDIANTIVQNGGIVELEMNIGMMVPTAEIVNQVSCFTIQRAWTAGINGVIECSTTYYILFSYRL